MTDPGREISVKLKCGHLITSSEQLAGDRSLGAEVTCPVCQAPSPVVTVFWPDGQPVTPWADPWHDVAKDVRDTAREIEEEGPGYGCSS